jgi:hypothetical protein
MSHRHPLPVWCTKCRLRIAPYEMRVVVGGKDYHRNCFERMVREGAIRQSNSRTSSGVKQSSVKVTRG